MRVVPSTIVNIFTCIDSFLAAGIQQDSPPNTVQLDYYV